MFDILHETDFIVVFMSLFAYFNKDVALLHLYKYRFLRNRSVNFPVSLN